MITPLFYGIIIRRVWINMDKERLKLIVKNLELLVESLKSEIYSDKDSYTKKCIEDNEVYKSVFEDDDGYPY